jgi:hypothetical protein
LSGPSNINELDAPRQHALCLVTRGWEERTEPQLGQLVKADVRSVSQASPPMKALVSPALPMAMRTLPRQPRALQDMETGQNEIELLDKAHPAKASTALAGDSQPLAPLRA